MSEHLTTCRCDACVLQLADQSLAKAIVWRLGLNGHIEDTSAAEQAVLIAVSRAMVEFKDKQKRKKR
jgi:hypothetical protein